MTATLAGTAWESVVLARSPLSRRLARHLPEDFARREQVVPVARTATTLEVATLIATPDLERRVAIAAASPVRLRVAFDPLDIAYGLEMVYGDPARAAALREEAVARMLVRLCFLDASTLNLVLAQPRDDLPLLRRLVEQRWVTDDAAAQALALTLHLPYVQLGAWPVRLPVARIAPREITEGHDVVPFALYRGQLYVALADCEALAALPAVARTTGFPVVPVVAARGAIRSVLRVAWGEQAPADSSPEAPSTVVAAPLTRQRPTSWWRAVQDLRSARSLAGREQAGVRATGAGWLRGPDLSVAPQAVRLLPAALVRRLGGLPLRQEGKKLVLAVRRPLDPLTREVYETLLARPLTEVVVGEAIHEALAERWYPEPVEAPATVWPEDLRAAREPFDRFLLAMGYLTPDQADAVRRREQALGRGRRALLIESGVLTEEALAEALGLWLGAPWIAVDQWLPDLDAPHLVPHAVARRFGVLPLTRTGSGLLIAAAYPDNQTALDDIAELTQATLGVAVATRSSLARALERWFGEADAELSVEFVRVAEALVRDGRLSPSDRAWFAEEHLRAREAPDQTAVRLGLFTEEAFTQAAADALGLPVLDLTPGERFVPGVDALGNEVTIRRLTDPVDRDVARLLTERQARAWGVIPFRRERGRVLVAMAWPEAHIVSAVRSALNEDCVPVLARRSQIESAIARHLGRPRLGDALLAAGLVRPDQLDAAAVLAERTGLRLGEALVSLGSITESQLVAYLAEQHGLPHFDLQGAELDVAAARLVPQAYARRHRVLPISSDGEQIMVALVDPMDSEAQAEVARITGLRVQPVLVTPSEFAQAYQSLYRDDDLETSARLLMTRSPQDSAARVLSDGQKGVFLAALVVSVLLFAWQPIGFLSALVIMTNLFYLTISFYKFYLIGKALGYSLEIPISPAEVAALDERDLPVYTILVPLYRETEVLPTLVEAIGRLDYPKGKLDVKLLLEEDDVETVRVARAARLPAHFEIVVVPNSRPKGKPKACNYGLLHARGAYTVIFDAEDVPDPDQLKKVVLAFRKGSPRLGCVQCKLNYYNQNQNLLTRWFTAEYSMWFDLFLPGLDASHAPIPLGGTSNHFPTIVLQELGAWDPYNVTEDADLGIRLFKRGYTTAVVDSTTYEEANSAVYNWIRQRSRWVKGYIQTWLVHMRNPLALYRSVGPAGFFSIQMTVFGTFFTFLVNPIFWALTALWFLTRSELIGELFPGWIYYVGSISLFLGNFLFTYMMMMGCVYRRYYSLVKYNAIVALYWYLMSFAAWKGFLQLFHNPFYWEKTTHGLYRGQVFAPQGGTGSSQG